MANEDAKAWYASKTVWTGIASVIGAAGGYMTGGMTAADAIQLAAIGLVGIFQRIGTMK